MTRRHAPATARNRGPILEVLTRVLPRHGRVLEIASGTGEHAVYFANALPTLRWMPSDVDPDSLKSISLHREDNLHGNVDPPIFLNTAYPTWPLDSADALVCINMVHITPWEATLGLFAGAGKILPKGAPLYLYGPYRMRERATAESNEKFELWLKAQDPRFGLRHLHDVEHAADLSGFRLEESIDMPANNLSVIFRRS